MTKFYTRSKGKPMSNLHIFGTLAAAGGGGGGTPATGFNVTIASGTVSTDLLDFPVMIDMNDMPAAFWLGVRSDGGNIRAYTADGLTMIPIDVTYIDVSKGYGRMFVKHSITAASDTVFKIVLLDPSNTMLASTDPNGQQAVWSDFEAVVVYPATKNRVDDAAFTVVGANGGVYDWKEVAQENYTAHQGVAYDGTYHYAVDTNYLRKYSTGLTVVASNADPCSAMNAATGETTLNHCGAPTIVDGELWVPMEVYPAGTYNKQYIGRFSLANLSLIGYIHLTGATRESSALIVDNTSNRVYVTDYTNGASIPYFDKSTGAYQGVITLSSSLSGIQGIADLGGGQWVVSCDSFPRGPIYVQSNGTVGGYVFKEWYTGQIEGISYHAASGTLTFDNGYIRDYRVVQGVTDFRRSHGTVSYLTVPTQSIWTTSISMRTTKYFGQWGILGVNTTGDSGTGVRTAVARRGTGKWAIWNSTDGWLETAVTPDYYQTHRIGIQHNGTTARKAYANGAATLDSVCALRPPSGATMEWFIGASNSYNEETAYGDFQYAWLRAEAMTDAWMAADAANNNNPSAFYSVVAD